MNEEDADAILDAGWRLVDVAAEFTAAACAEYDAFAGGNAILDECCHGLEAPWG
jgi:hypothetical protein